MGVGVNARTAFSLLFPPILDEFGWPRRHRRRFLVRVLRLGTSRSVPRPAHGPAGAARRHAARRGPPVPPPRTGPRASPPGPPAPALGLLGPGGPRGLGH